MRAALQGHQPEEGVRREATSECGWRGWAPWQLSSSSREGGRNHRYLPGVGQGEARTGTSAQGPGARRQTAFGGFGQGEASLGRHGRWQGSCTASPRCFEVTPGSFRASGAARADAHGYNGRKAPGAAAVRSVVRRDGLRQREYPLPFCTLSPAWRQLSSCEGMAVCMHTSVCVHLHASDV